MKLLLFIIIGLLIYIICEMKKGEENQREPHCSFREVLADYRGKICEITVKEPLMIDIMFSVRGILVDLDDEWVMVKTQDKKKKSIKIFRVDNVSGIKEIV